MNTVFQYDHYFDYEELSSHLYELAETYKDLMDLEVICVTEEKRNVYGVTVTAKKTGAADTKPGFHVDGNIHAGEITGSMAAMHMLDYLLCNYGTDEKVTGLLDTMAFYFVPRISPDGTETWLKTPYTIRSVNRIHGAECGGVQEKDLDGDGVIRMMRIPTPYGAWKKDASGAMVMRDPGDRIGEFYDIYPEGEFEPYSGDENLRKKKADWGLDFNRSFPYGWFPENRQAGAGKYPLSSPETKALADWIIAHPNIAAGAANHTSGGLLLYPPGTKSAAKAKKDDIKVFETIAEMGRQELGYEPLNIFDGFISDQEHFDSGAFDDWCYETQGMLSFTIEYWDLAKRVGVPYVFNQRKDEDLCTVVKRFNAMVEWVKKNAPEDWTDWTPYEHPAFGKVDIGGLNYKFTVQNPPKAFLKELMEQSTRFLMRYASALPCLTVDSLESEKLGGDIYQITAIVGNTGYLPTNISDQALEIEIAEKPCVSLSGGEVLSGEACRKIEHLSGYSRTATGSYAYGNISTLRNAAQKKKLTWVIRAEQGTEITVVVKQTKSGTAEKSIVL